MTRCNRRPRGYSPGDGLCIARSAKSRIWAVHNIYGCMSVLDIWNVERCRHWCELVRPKSKNMNVMLTLLLGDRSRIFVDRPSCQ